MSTEEHEPTSSTPESRVLSYEVATTSIVYGLPPVKSSASTVDYSMSKRPGNKVNTAYSMSKQPTTTVKDSDDSLFSDDEDDKMPPLIPGPNTLPLAASEAPTAAEPLTDSATEPEIATGKKTTFWNTGSNTYWSRTGKDIPAEQTVNVSSARGLYTARCLVQRLRWALELELEIRTSKSTVSK
ncbi:hypothetical protein B0H10DRAFT_1968368 [Mycena sp. CBHHK59/15]|nr:hypothetical protein B0H10DRAFT_1968368 [Mycena sp. CBHHK59/15]